MYEQKRSRYVCVSSKNIGIGTRFKNYPFYCNVLCRLYCMICTVLVVISKPAFVLISLRPLRLLIYLLFF